MPMTATKNEPGNDSALLVVIKVFKTHWNTELIHQMWSTFKYDFVNRFFNL